MLCEELITHRLNFRHPDLLLLKSIPLKSRVIEDDNFLNLRAFRKDLPDLRKLIPGDKDPLGFGVIDTENKVLTFSKIDRKGHIRSARIHCSELGEHGIMTHEKDYFIAFLDTESHKACAYAVCFFSCLVK